MKIYLVIFAAAVCSFQAASATDVRFESSDGVWADGECGFKGRSFGMVVDSFERYKFAAHKPSLTLVRVTPFPQFTFFMSRKEKNSPKWNVPYRPPSGFARAIVLDVPEKEKEAVDKRSREAYEKWCRK